MGGLCCRQKKTQEPYIVRDNVYSELPHDSRRNTGAALPEESLYETIAYAPESIHSLHPSAPGLEETSEVLENRTVTCTSNGEVSVKRSALFCAAIDFGTTYTGYAFSSKHDHTRVFTMTSEEGSSKVPTVLLFDQNKKFHSFGYEAQKKYKELLDRDNHREWYLFKEFKMTLFQSKELKENTPLKDFQDKIEMPAIDIFACAIQFIKTKLLEDLAERGSGVLEGDIHWVLTVPAIWTDSAKQFMRKAAAKAGILNEMLSLALEPEAASVYCRDDFPCVGKVGTRYILLDLGGGTADITCHRVEDGGLKELHIPQGGGFGGTDVEEKFKKLLVDIFGLAAVKSFKEKHLKEFWEMLADFEISKRKFDGNDQLVVNFPAQFRESFGEQEHIDDALQKAGCCKDIEIKRGRMFISKDKGQWIFDKTIDQVIERTQILLKVIGDVDYIVLVGGFSESKYLQTRMKETFGDKIVAPIEPRTAVMRGAVLFGQSPAAIQTRVSKYTYGIATMNRFKPEIHLEEKRIVIDGHEYCDDIFEKHVTIGQEITVGQNMKEMTYHPTIDNQAHAVLQVFASSKESPEYVTDEDCQQVGLVLVELNTDRKRDFEIKVKLIFGGTEIQVEVRDGHGKSIKEARMDFLG
ncbi:heat shock 70 kDa protein 12A-like isoform X2 [Mya arenaria]|uniref:heat shock 70 kDa protein 12A-like isoform X2 n=1 Tax=Mya arenaria TaxID=6604 RepID=UPI0022E35205|nr:heat shock 70 kDa protein 12A-like isoform X2 [Mya arenaria]